MNPVIITHSPCLQKRVQTTFEAGEELSVLTALYRFGTTELCEFVYRLRASGIPVKDRGIRTPSSKHYKVYY